MVSINIARWSSPLPFTRKVSELSVSCTRRLRLVSSSLMSLSRSCLVVQNLPSFPARGEVLTTKVISTVGSPISRRDAASPDSADGNSAFMAVIVQVGNEHLERSYLDFRRRHVSQYGFENW